MPDAADLLTTAEAAADLGLAPRTVQAIARQRGLGRTYGKARLLTPEDVAAMRTRAPRGNHSGQPRRRVFENAPPTP